MPNFLATSAAALMNLLVLLGMAFVLSRTFGLLRTLPKPQRKVILGIAFGVIAVGSMMVSFPMAPGIIGDLRNAAIAIAAIVGGPVPALIATAAAIVFRVQLGGHFVAASAGSLLPRSCRSPSPARGLRGHRATSPCSASRSRPPTHRCRW